MFDKTRFSPISRPYAFWVVSLGLLTSSACRDKRTDSANPVTTVAEPATPSDTSSPAPNSRIESAPDHPAVPIVLARLKTDGGGGGPKHIAVDAGFVYVTLEDHSGTDSTVSIVRLSIAGGPPKVLASKQRDAQGLAIAGGHLYWSTAADLDRNLPDTVVRMPVGGGKISVVTKALVKDPSTPILLHFDDTSLVSDGANVFFAEAEAGFGRILKISSAEGSISEIAKGTDQDLSKVAIDSQAVYWLASNSLLKAPLSGGAPIELATTTGPGTGNVWGLASDGKYVYWSDRNNYKGDHANTGAIRRVSTNGGAVETVASNLPGRPWDIVVDETHVYWVINAERDGGIMRVSKTGGTPFMVVAGQRSAVHLAADATHIYWCNTGDGVVATFGK